MAIPIQDKERDYLRFRESVALPGEVAVKVVNPDGTNLFPGATAPFTVG